MAPKEIDLESEQHSLPSYSDLRKTDGKYYVTFNKNEVQLQRARFGGGWGFWARYRWVRVDVSILRTGKSENRSKPSKVRIISGTTHAGIVGEILSDRD